MHFKRDPFERPENQYTTKNQDHKIIKSSVCLIPMEQESQTLRYLGKKGKAQKPLCLRE